MDPESEILERLPPALEGDKDALQGIVRLIQDPIYRLALRTLGNVGDAQDASQDILLRIITRLSTFRGESRFMTWAYRISVNALSDRLRKKSVHRSFEELDTILGQEPVQIAAQTTPDLDRDLLAREVFLGCSLAIVTCLSPELRIAFILGAILGFDHQEAASVLDISPTTYRKRLSRARKLIRDFLLPRCSMTNPEAPCKCEHQIPINMELGRLRPKALRLVNHPCTEANHALRQGCNKSRGHAAIDHIETLIEATEFIRKQPKYRATTELRTMMKRSIGSLSGV